MSDYELVVGSSSQRIPVTLNDSSSTTGGGLTGLAFNTASLVCYYWREDEANANATAVTLATATRGTWATGGFVEKDATNMPGEYEFSIPNAALASGAKWVKIKFKGAANLAPRTILIRLMSVNIDDAVRGGMTALPNANAEAAGGLYTRGTGAGQIRQDANGRIDANAKAWIDGTIPAVNVTGVPLVDDKYLLGTIYSTPATAGIQDINVKNMNNVAATPITTIKAVQGLAVDGVVTTLSNLPSIPANWLTAAGIASGAFTNAKFAASAIDAAALATDAAQEIADALLDRDMSTGTDSGSPSVRTVRQALRMLRNKASISAGTLTVTKEDDATASWTAAVTTAAGNPISAIDPA